MNFLVSQSSIRYRNLSILVVLVITAVFVSSVMVSCDDFEKNTYRVLATGKQTYIATMQSVRDLQDRGLISDEQRQDINEIAEVYYAAWQIAADAFEVYKLTQSAADKDKVSSAVAEASRALGKLLERVKPFIDGGDK